MKKAIVLFSGGLDSTLATRILQEQGIEVVGLNFVTPFHDATKDAQSAADACGIELVVHRVDDDYMNLVAQPRWGYGKAVNPCVDCRVDMCRVAKRLMEQRGAAFVATGELAGQRPNSQMQHQLDLIARESGLRGYLLRPLSAIVLSPTEPEIRGLVDRSKLFGYTGRGRGRLIMLANRLGIEKIPQPSTGCFLCETSYSPRLLDLFKHEPAPTVWDADALNAGRQIRISPKVKAVIGRNEEHCDRIEALFARSDAKPSIMFIPETFQGPSVLLIGPNPETDSPEEFRSWLDLGGALILRYTNPAKYDSATTTVCAHFGSEKKIIPAKTDEKADGYRVI